MTYRDHDEHTSTMIHQYMYILPYPYIFLDVCDHAQKTLYLHMSDTMFDIYLHMKKKLCFSSIVPYVNYIIYKNISSDLFSPKI